MKKLFVLVLMLCMALCLSAGALAAEDYILNESGSDMEEFFSEAELEELNARAEALWEKEGVGVYFVLVDDTDGMSTGDYSEWYYMEHDFIPVSAIVMIANIARGETKVYADGEICLNKLTVEDLDRMKTGYDDASTYAGGVRAYLKTAEKCFGFDAAKALLIAVIVGAVVALSVVLILRGQLKSVRAQRGAANYTRPGSMVVTERYENFLYRTVNRQAKPQDNGGGPGGHGGGGKSGGGLRSH